MIGMITTIMTIDKSDLRSHETAMSFVKLDKRDIAVLSILSREGRIAKSALADKVNLSATACGERLARLETAGIITGYQAHVALRRIVRRPARSAPPASCAQGCCHRLAVGC